MSTEPQVFPTNIPALDEKLEGGFRAGEAVLILNHNARNSLDLKSEIRAQFGKKYGVEINFSSDPSKVETQICKAQELGLVFFNIYDTAKEPSQPTLQWWPYSFVFELKEKLGSFELVNHKARRVQSQYTINTEKVEVEI